MSLVTPILLVIVLWWLGTGLVLYLQQRIVEARTPTIITLALISLSSLAAMVFAAGGLQTWHSYLGLVAAISLWGCIELSYYTGLIGGVHTRSCPEHCDTGRRFRLALGASIWHEVSVLFAGGVVVTLLLGAQNPAGLYSFLVLWLMRWSAKLNLFFGVPNFNTDWFPKRLAYAHSYIRRSRISLFFPVSVSLAIIVTFQMFSSALAGPPDKALSMLLPSALLMLAILEHLFMALPIADTELWNRVFARDTNEHTDKDPLSTGDCVDDDSILCIKERSQRRINKVLTPATNRPVSVTLAQVKATATPTVSR